MTTASGPTDRPTALTRIVLALAGVIAFAVFSFSIPFFFSVDNLINLLNEVALAGIVAMPATFLIMSGQVDLSVGATAAFVGIVLAAMAPQSGLLTAVVLAVGTGLLIGLVNGLLVTAGGVPSIAATFASMALIRGLAYLVPSGLAITVAGFRSLGNTRPVLGIALPTLIFAACALTAAVLSRSAVGRRSRETGRLQAAARLDVARERRWVITLFVVSGLCAALVGLIRTSQLGTGLPTAAIGLELTVVTAVLLGGGRLAGGRGSVGGTLIALLMISIIDSGLSLANVTAYAGQVFHAALLLLALVIDRPVRRSRNQSGDASSSHRQHLPARPT